MDLQELEERYLKAKEAYYNGEPIMEDWEFDLLEQELKDNFSDVINVVGFSDSDKDKNEKVKHWNKMLSLSKITATQSGIPPTDDFLNWYASRKKLLGVEDSLLLSSLPKFDGNSCNLQYIGGQLINAITRGNGVEGRNILDKVKHFVPNRININDDVEIRGEILFTKEHYDIWKTPETKNPRNYVAGILNRDEMSIDLLKDLSFVAFGIQYKSSIDKFELNEDVILSNNGFNVLEPIDTLRIENESDFIFAYNHFLNCRISEDYPFVLDGFVIKIDSPEYRSMLGENSHDPEWALAVKFPAEGAKTMIESISWNLASYGELVPIANLLPVDLDGSTVRRASLASWGNLKSRNCYPGAEVKVCKSGDIIPYIYEVITPSTVPINLPTNCPSCDSILHVDDIHIECRNLECEGQLKRRFGASMPLLGYQWFGPSIMELFWNSGFRTTLDFFNPEKMNRDYLINSGFFQDGRLLDRLFNELEKVKEIEFWKLIASFKIKGVGKTASKEIAKLLSGNEYNFANLERQPLELFLDSEYIGRKWSLQLLDLIEAKGIKVLFPGDNGIIIEFTGSPKSAGFATKEEFLSKIKDYGFTHGGLKEAKYLVTDDLNSTSSKMKTASKKGIEIYDYSQFINKFCSDIKTESNESTLF